MGLLKKDYQNGGNMEAYITRNFGDGVADECCSLIIEGSFTIGISVMGLLKNDTYIIYNHIYIMYNYNVYIHTSLAETNFKWGYMPAVNSIYIQRQF